MKKIKNFAIDDFPHTLNPTETFDYSSKLVVSLLYEPLFFCVDGDYRSNIIKKTHYEDKILEFYFADWYWSNGEKVKPYNLYQTLVYILQYQPKLRSYLSFIKGVEDDDNEMDIVNVGLSYDDKKIVFATKYEVMNYQQIFSIPQFSILYFNEEHQLKNKITNGKFIVSEYKKDSLQLTLKKNRYYKLSHIDFEGINFIYVKSIEENISLFEEGVLDITCSTFFPFHLIERYKNAAVFNRQKSNIEISLHINNEKLKKYKNDLERFVKTRMLNNRMLSQGLDIEPIKCKRCELINEDSVGGEKIVLLLPDYYPNNKIINIVAAYFMSVGYEVVINEFPLKEYVKHKKDYNYDVSLDLSSLLVNNLVERLINEMNFIADENLDEYIDMLNIYLENYENENLTNIFDYIAKYSFKIYLGKINHIYLKTKELHYLHFNENDVYTFEKIIKENYI